MKSEYEDIGYAHGHLGAIEKGMPVFDSDNNEIGVVDSTEFATEQAAQGKESAEGFIKVRNEDLHVAYHVTADQINYVNEGVVQLSVSEHRLTQI